VTPLLTDLRASWNPAGDQAMVLCHPWTGGRFSGGSGWPDAGLGRELPVMAALGALDAIDVCSYSNAGGVQLSDWYDLLNCGLRVPPSAGTDAVTNHYLDRPPGGYRVYVKEFPPSPHTVSKWVSGLRAGRSFVSAYPLVPIFTVNGAQAGSVLSLSDPPVDVQVHFRVLCTLPASWATLILNGEIAGSFPLTADADGAVAADVTTTLTLYQSSWIALRVDGYTNLPHAATTSLFAHSGPVYVELDGAPIHSPTAPFRFIAWIDSLEALAEMRGYWPTPESHEEVLSRFDAARSFYAGAVLKAPEPVTRSPGPGIRLSVSPRPAHGRVRLIVEPAAGGGALDIFDVQGCMVASSKPWPGAFLREDGPGRFLWDGRLADGRDAPSGVYWAVAHARPSAEARGDGFVASERIVWVR
jgi:hypothetical protein